MTDGWPGRTLVRPGAGEVYRMNPKLTHSIGRCALILIVVATLGLSQRPAGAQSSAPEHARLVFDPLVTQQDQELIAEAVRLAEDFFVARFAAPLGADVTVTALPIAGPNDADLVAATIGDSIVIYTESLGWRESPPAERIRAVVHEYTHAYQYAKTADVPLESAAWFEEGVAEYLSMLALTELGLVNPVAMEGRFGAIVRHSKLPALQELESYDALHLQPAEVYPLSYFGVARLLRDLPLAAIDVYYSALQQGTPFAQAFELAYGVSPERFYMDFAAFRDNDLPTGSPFPQELEISDGIDQPSAVIAEETPRFVIPGEQALVIAAAVPGTNCSLDLTINGTTVAIEDRETFANGSGTVFWFLTVPADLSSGKGDFVVSCGSDPLTIPVLVS